MYYRPYIELVKAFVPTIFMVSVMFNLENMRFIREKTRV